jgi:hypothetical protein
MLLSVRLRRPDYLPNSFGQRLDVRLLLLEQLVDVHIPIPASCGIKKCG